MKMTRFIIISKTTLKQELKFQLSRILVDASSTVFGEKNDSMIEFFSKKRLRDHVEISVVCDSRLMTESKYDKFTKIISNKLSENNYKTDIISFKLLNQEKITRI